MHIVLFILTVCLTVSCAATGLKKDVAERYEEFQNQFHIAFEEIGPPSGEINFEIAPDTERYTRGVCSLEMISSDHTNPNLPKIYDVKVSELFLLNLSPYFENVVTHLLCRAKVDGFRYPDHYTDEEIVATAKSLSQVCEYVRLGEEKYAAFYCEMKTGNQTETCDKEALDDVIKAFKSFIDTTPAIRT